MKLLPNDNFLEKKLLDQEMQNTNSAKSKAEYVRSKHHITIPYNPICALTIQWSRRNNKLNTLHILTSW